MSDIPALFPGRETIATKLGTLSEENQALIAKIFDNASQDELLLEALHLFLDKESQSPFLNTLKLQSVGEWLGNNAPARLQVRLMEIAKSGQHAVHVAFREGLKKSGGLERAFPQSPV